MSFHSDNHRGEDGYTDRKNSTEELSGLLGSPHSIPDKADCNQRQRQRPWLLIIVVFETFALVMIGAGLLYLLLQSSSQFPPNAVFSPAQHVIRYKNIVFSSGFEPHLSKYQGSPSPETDDAWRELYDYAVVGINRKDATKLANRTIPIPGDQDHYAVSIDVFHQLHCLQMLRKRAWYAEGYEFDRAMMRIEHVDHCIDSIRQSLMCSADVTPLTWNWAEKDQRLEPVATITHTCRDFDAIREWARRNVLRGFDTSVHIEPDV